MEGEVQRRPRVGSAPIKRICRSTGRARAYKRTERGCTQKLPSCQEDDAGAYERMGK